MAAVYKRLGAATGNGVIGTGATVYSASAPTVVSTIVVCNTSSTAGTYSIGVSTASAYEQSGYIVYQAAIAGNDTIGLTFGLTMDTTNKFLLASTSASTISVSAFGSEVS